MTGNSEHDMKVGNPSKTNNSEVILIFLKNRCY